MKVFVKSAIAVVLIACGIFITFAQTKKSGAAKVSKAAARALYVSNCARCHGADGKSNTPKGIETAADDLTTARVKRKSLGSIHGVIANGEGEMPGFGGKLSKAEIAAVANYIRSL